jgi:hypothetical protein
MKERTITGLSRMLGNAEITLIKPHGISTKDYALEKGRSYYDSLMIEDELFHKVEEWLFQNKSITVKDFLEIMVNTELDYVRE